MDNVVKEFTDKVSSSVYKKTFVKLVLAKRVLDNQELNKILVRYVELDAQPHLQFVYKYNRNDVTKNFTVEEGVQQLQAIIGSNFLDIILFTTKEDVELKYNSKRVPKLYTKKATFNEAADGKHDVGKQRRIDTKNSVYLKSLGITDNKGEIIPSMSAKYKQVEKFIEIIDSFENQYADGELIKVIDAGCGKGYLTFATYDFLTNVKERKVDMIGIETQDNLVKFCNNLAQKSQFSGLSFIQSNINEYKVDKADILIALHACDTATDDAIYTGIKAEAKLIIVSPCCHKQIRNQMKITESNVLEPVLNFGILLERQAEIITDGLRALILELNGYKTKVFEFVDAGNSPKNLIITAEKTSLPNDERRAQLEKQISAIKNKFGIKYHYLEKLIENPVDQSWRILNAQCAKEE